MKRLVIALALVWAQLAHAQPCPTTPPTFFAQGCYEGNGNDDRKIVTGITNPGLLLVKQKVTLSGGELMVMRIPEFTGDSSCIVAGTATPHCTTNQIQEQNTDGYFVIGTSARVNTADANYCWYQWGKGTNHNTFLYTGDGSGVRDINSPLSPSFAFVQDLPNNNDYTYLRTSLMPALISNPWNELASGFADANHIRALGTDSITVGSAFNLLGRQHWAAVWASATNYGNDVTWTGNGTGGTGGTCALPPPDDVQTVSSACATRNVIFTECQSFGCTPETCTVHGASASGIRGENIGTAVVGPGHLPGAGGGSDYYWQAPAGLLDEQETLIGVLAGNTFNVSGAPSFGNSLNDLGANAYAFVTCAPGPTIGTVSVPDWSPAFVGVYHCEEVSDVTRTNNECVDGITGGTIACGFAGCDCDLSNNGTVAQDTVEKRIGAASCLMAAADGDFLRCDMATDCNEFDLGQGGASVTWGAFVRSTVDADQSYIAKSGSTIAQYRMGRSAAADTFYCQAKNTSGTSIFASSPASASSINAWHFSACTFDNTANTIENYADGIDGGPSAILTDLQGGNGTFNLGHTSSVSPELTGNIDEAWVYAGALITADKCRLCSCGVTGGACSCLSTEPTLYVDEGYNDSMCDNCTLPLCNKGGPT